MRWRTAKEATKEDRIDADNTAENDDKDSMFDYEPEAHDAYGDVDADEAYGDVEAQTPTET